MNTYLYDPDVTFADTNVVGNVYFSNYFRWQDECRNEWLRHTTPRTYEEVAQGTKRIRVREVSFEYNDPTGIGVAEPIDVGMNIEKVDTDRYHAATTIRRRTAFSPPSCMLHVAKGHQQFDLVSNGNALANDGLHQESMGNAYKIDFSPSLELFRWNGWIDSLDLIRWQGKCREQFLVDHARETLQLVAERQLALHTSKVGLHILRDVRVSTSESVGIQMVLTHLRGGRLTVRFDYFLWPSGDGINGRMRFATGEQSVSCKRPSERGLMPAVFPADMLLALRRFANSPALKANIDEALDFQREDVEAINQNRADGIHVDTRSVELVAATLTERTEDGSCVQAR